MTYSSRVLLDGEPSFEDDGAGINWSLNLPSLGGSFSDQPCLDDPPVTGVVVVKMTSCPTRQYHFRYEDDSFTLLNGSDDLGVSLALDCEQCEFTFTDCDEANTKYIFDGTGTLIATEPPELEQREVTCPAGTPANSVCIQFARTVTLPDGSTAIGGYINAYSPVETATSSLSAAVPAGSRLGTSTTFLLKSGATTYYERLRYSYYQAGDEFGSAGDLKTATRQVLVGGQWLNKATFYYRYYLEGQPNGFEHGLKYVLRGDAFARLKEDPAVSDPFTASDSVVATYADNYFEYNADAQVTRSVTQGGSFDTENEYATSEFADGYNSWTYKMVVDRPNGSQQITYANYLYQPIVEVLKNGSDEWVNYFKYDTAGRMLEHAHPSAVISYDENQADMGVTLQASSGQIDVTDYYASTTATETTPGGVEGYVQFSKVKEGSGGTEVKLSETTYFARSAGGDTSYRVAESSSFRNEDGTGQITTSYAYEYWPDTTRIQQTTTTLPVISSAQNGSGTANQRVSIFDFHGRVIWSKDERGFISYQAYDELTVAMIQSIADVDMSLMSGYPQKPTWITPTGGGLHLITDYESDFEGRTTQTLGPWHAVEGQSVRTASWTLYNDETSETLSAQGYATGPESDYDYTLVEPVSISQVSSDGLVARNVSALRCTSSGRLSPSDCFPQSSWVRWSESQFNELGQMIASRTYFDIPETGTGKLNVNYNESRYGYDVMNRQNRQVSPGGTITRTVFDIRGNVIESWVGTNDTDATDSDPTGGGAAGNNMVPITASQYDNGNPGGDNFLTQSTQHVDGNSSNDRVTNYTYDFRGRQLTLQGEESLFTANTYNNLGQVTQVDRYNGSESAANLIGRRKTFYDDLGRTYRAETYAVTVGTGAIGNHLYSLTWYDPAGNTIKQVQQGAKEGKAFTKMAYDGIGRNTASYVGYFTGSGQETYAEASAIGSTSKIFEQTYITYDDASNTIATASYQRFHTATGGGELNLPGTIEPKARVSYMAYYYDGVGRQTATANYGTNDNVSFTRPGATPAASDDVLVSLTSYNIEGEAYLTTDPASMVTRSDFDDAGRQIRTIQNYVPFGEETAPAEPTATSCPCPTDDDSCLPPGNDENVMVETVYNADGQVSQLIAKNPTTGDQVTQYIYGTTLAESDIARNDLLAAEIYPDAVDSTDRMTYTYDRSGDRTSMTDQNGTVHEYDYDALGRRTADRVTNAATGIDDSVLRIETSYEVRGLVESVTSYDAATSGSVVNQVQYEYNDYGQLITEYEAHDGAVNTGTTPKVQYTYADGSSNTVRSTGFIYPNGNTLTHGYGAGSSDDDLLSRIVDLIHSLSPSDPITYSYFGLGSVYEIDYTEPDVALDYATGSGGNPYTSLDRFGRVIDMNWENYGTSTSLDHIQYGYDRASNRTWRKNLVAPAGFDELYSYDGLHRLKTADRGQLSDDESRIESNFEFHQAWNLDATGNWSGFEQFDQDDANQALVQQRTHNEVNEIIGIGETVGPQWATPSHDRNGNMTVIPQPKSPAEAYGGTYDAWNRLTKLTDSDTEDVVSVYYYDGVNRRIKSDEYDTGVFQHTRHYFFNNQWQNLEERINSSTDPERQYVWGIQYIDQLHLRQRDTDGNGTFDEKLWAIQDRNWNVTGICNLSGAMEERYVYLPYGRPCYLSSLFKSLSTSHFNWEHLFTARSQVHATSLYYYRTRYYHYLAGRFVGRDPIGYAGGLNLYSYVNGNPQNRIDPMGLMCSCVCTLEKGRKSIQGPVTKLLGVGDPLTGAPTKRSTRGISTFYGCEQYRIVNYSYRCPKTNEHPSFSFFGTREIQTRRRVVTGTPVGYQGSPNATVTIGDNDTQYQFYHVTSDTERALAEEECETTTSPPWPAWGTLKKPKATVDCPGVA